MYRRNLFEQTLPRKRDVGLNLMFHKVDFKSSFFFAFKRNFSLSNIVVSMLLLVCYLHSLLLLILFLNVIGILGRPISWTFLIVSSTFDICSSSLRLFVIFTSRPKTGRWSPDQFLPVPILQLLKLLISLTCYLLFLL